MSKPTDKSCAIVIENASTARSIRLARVGKGPLVEVWVHEDWNGGRGIILDVEQSDKFIEAWQDLLDKIEAEREEVSPA